MFLNLLAIRKKYLSSLQELLSNCVTESNYGTDFLKQLFRDGLANPLKSILSQVPTFWSYATIAVRESLWFVMTLVLKFFCAPLWSWYARFFKKNFPNYLFKEAAIDKTAYWAFCLLLYPAFGVFNSGILM